MKSWPAILLAVLLVLLAVVGALFWQLSRESAAAPQPPVLPTAELSAPAGAAPVGPVPTTPPATFDPAPLDPAPSTDGADRIGAILADENLENAAVVRRLLALIPTLEEDDAMEAAQHAVNLTDDEDLSLWLSDLVADRYPQPVAEIFFGDLLNRPQEVLFPSLAQIADNPRHSLRSDSEELLEVLFSPRPENLTWRQWIAQQQQEEN
jgi:hypothetical protein